LLSGFASSGGRSDDRRLRRRLEYPELKRAVADAYARWRPDVVLIEDKASGTQLIQELVAEGLHAVTRYRPQTDKVIRMHAQTAAIENGLPPAADCRLARRISARGGVPLRPARRPRSAR
jgi:Terminase RNaseH-like domain